MKTTISELRNMIRKVITEANIKDLDTSGIYRPKDRKPMSPNDPDYESVADVINMVSRDLMFGHIGADEVPEKCELYAGDYQVHHHLEYIIDKVMSRIEAMGL